jgi:hypothetical protein
MSAAAQSGSSAAWSVAARIAGAVSLPIGSMRMQPGSIPTSCSCSATMKRKSEVVTIIGALKLAPVALAN